MATSKLSSRKKATDKGRVKGKNENGNGGETPPPDSPPPKVRWTVMVYLAGDNNLTEECAFAVSEMRQVDLSENVRVLVQFDPKGTHLPTQRFRITPASASGNAKKASRNPTKVSEIVHDPTHGRPYNLGETPTGSPRTLYDFIAYGIQTYPAHSYLVVLSGHGGGVEDTFFLRDESPTGTLSLKGMKWAFKEIHEDFGVVVDIVGLDTCLMSMAEVAYQLKDNAHILVGSEGYAPLGGWPYRPILEMISYKADHTEFDPSKPDPQEALLKREREDVAKSIVCVYANYYLSFVSGGIDVEQSALDISRSGKLAELVNHLGSQLTARLTDRLPDRPFKLALILAHWDAQSYNGEIYVDLRDFCTCLKQRLKDLDVHADDVTKTCDKIEVLIGSCCESGKREECRQCLCPRDFSPDPTPSNYYVLKSCYTGPTFQYSYGVSLYFPWYELIPYYEDLDFAQATDWHKFLDKYIIETRRCPRKNGQRMLGDEKSTKPVRNSSGKNSSGKFDRPIIRSMRNAPISLDGLSRCFDPEDADIKEIFKGL
jgi:hypothetical protein